MRLRWRRGGGNGLRLSRSSTPWRRGDALFLGGTLERRRERARMLVHFFPAGGRPLLAAAGRSLTPGGRKGQRKSGGGEGALLQQLGRHYKIHMHAKLIQHHQHGGMSCTKTAYGRVNKMAKYHCYTRRWGVVILSQKYLALAPALVLQYVTLKEKLEEAKKEYERVQRR